MDITMIKAPDSKPANSRKSIAFIIESLVLLAFLIASLAVITQVFAGSINEATKSLEMERAVIAASNAAEEFASDPAQAAGSSTQGELTVTCEVTPQKLQRGTLYDAVITVTSEGETLYTLSTSRYEGQVGS